MPVNRIEIKSGVRMTKVYELLGKSPDTDSAIAKLQSDKAPLEIESFVDFLGKNPNIVKQQMLGEKEK